MAVAAAGKAPQPSPPTPLEAAGRRRCPYCGAKLKNRRAHTCRYCNDLPGLEPF